MIWKERRDGGSDGTCKSTEEMPGGASGHESSGDIRNVGSIPGFR